MSAPVGLRSLHLSNRYRSDRQDVVANFFVPAFTVASSYSRAVGYFTSTSLALYARGIETFAEHGGMMRLIASPHLNEDDIADIERGYDLRDVIERATVRELDSEDSDAVLAGLGLLGRLIAEGRLDIKLAFVEQEGRVGIYHEKIGVFRDDQGDLVGFTGSSNETYGGLMANFESVEVYQGWVPGDGARALQLEDDFQALWSNQTPTLSVQPFPDVARERLLRLASERPKATLPGRDTALTPAPVETSEPHHLAIPSWLTVRDYQREAVESWLRNQGRGILKMATGTGKTKTAMIAATQLSNALREHEQPLVIVIVAPQLHLVDQWITEVEEFGVKPIAIYDNSKKWQPIVESQMTSLRMGQRPLVVMVATNSSFAGAKFQSVLSRISQHLFVIADEAHNLGSSTNLAALPTNATYRLALSATPERWFDDEGTDELIKYFGEIIFELPMGQAIAMGALTRYHYYPRLVELTPDETEHYVDLTGQIARRIVSGESIADTHDDTALGRLLRDRANILGHAQGKVAALEADLKEHRDEWFQLVYCGEGNRPRPFGEVTGEKQLSEVMGMIGNGLRLSVHEFIGETPPHKRRELLRRFSSGNDLRILAAMKCLDEGVDIPDARLGYLLASSSNPRQFIQRRGRLLRRAEGKTHAVIFDYLAVPPADAPINFDVERKLLIREFQRANEFGKLSENYEETLEVLRPLKERYQLMDL
ncbi:DEAD/DEAH box helicase family protein [Arthrobacter sp. S1_S22]|nr:DEAD/DEAH box helicase family protein [Arthrobacter sp. S1_S22]